MRNSNAIHFKGKSFELFGNSFGRCNCTFDCSCSDLELREIFVNLRKLLRFVYCRAKIGFAKRKLEWITILRFNLVKTPELSKGRKWKKKNLLDRLCAMQCYPTTLTKCFTIQIKKNLTKSSKIHLTSSFFPKNVHDSFLQTPLIACPASSKFKSFLTLICRLLNVIAT